MSAQTIHDAFVPWEAEYKAQVMGATWGHLAPTRNKIYRGHIIFALGCCGSDYLNPTVLECELGQAQSPALLSLSLSGYGRGSEMNCPTCGRPHSACECTAIDCRKMTRDLSAWAFSAAVAWSIVWAMAAAGRMAYVWWVTQ